MSNIALIKNLLVLGACVDNPHLTCMVSHELEPQEQVGEFFVIKVYLWF